MADVTYTISIKADSVEENAPRTTAPGPSGNELSPKKKKSPQISKEEAYVQKTMKKVASVGFAMQAADMMVTHQINTIEARTGNSRLQQQCNFAYSTAKSLIGATVSGAMMGGVPGALIGLSSAIIMQGVQVAMAQQQINIARSVEDVSLSMARIRAGASGNRTGKDA